MLGTWLGRLQRNDNVFLFLLGYRWLSLLPPLLALWLEPQQGLIAVTIFVAALANNIILTALYPRLNRLLVRHPLSLSLDLLIVTALIGLSGGTHSPYYLLALSPILAAAFFFQMRGGLITACAMAGLYLLAAFVAKLIEGIAPDSLTALTQVVSFFLIASAFGYSAILLKRLRAASTALGNAHEELLRKNVSLERGNRELQSIHALALTMQSSSIDVYDVQERILTTITGELGFERAILGLVEPDSDILIGWLTQRRRNGNCAPDGLFHTSEIRLQPQTGLLAQTILSGEARYVSDAAPPTTETALNQRLALAPYAILPLIMRDHPVGVLIVDNPDSLAAISPDSLHSLVLVANQAAIALGSTRLCVERAQRLAVEEERNRIAMEIHDTASQSLFGIVYALDACMKQLPDGMEDVRAHLADTREIAQHTMQSLRRSVYDIWSGELSAAQFELELRAHLQRLDAPATLAVQIDIGDELISLSGSARKNLLRIAEEGLSNVVKHAHANRASVRLKICDGEAHLSIEDDGTGFDAQQTANAGFGLKSIQERARVIGAEFCLTSKEGHGTWLEVVLRNCAPALQRGGDANPARG
jgi:signal transduction histidine kinase